MNMLKPKTSLALFSSLWDTRDQLKSLFLIVCQEKPLRKHAFTGTLDGLTQKHLF